MSKPNFPSFKELQSLAFSEASKDHQDYIKDLQAELSQFAGTIKPLLTASYINYVKSQSMNGRGLALKPNATPWEFKTEIVFSKYYEFSAVMESLLKGLGYNCTCTQNNLYDGEYVCQFVITS